MNYRDIEIDGMKELLKENELEIGRLRKEIKTLKVIIENNDSEQKADWKHIEELEQENEKLKEKIEKLEKELSAAYKAYHTALGVDYISEEDLYDLDD